MKEPAEFVRRLNGMVDLRFVQQEKALGLAHAISCAQPVVGEEPFVVLLPDVIMMNEEPVTHQLIAAYEQLGGSVVAIRQVEPSELQRHGIVCVERSAGSRAGTSVPVTGLVEKPSADRAPSHLGVFGRYLLEPGIWEGIAQTRPDAKGEVQLTDALNLLCEKKPLFGLYFEGRHYDAGNPLGYLKASIELSLLDPQLRPSILEYFQVYQLTVSGRSLQHPRSIKKAQRRLINEGGTVR
jgi:UTP--glucose-1-phosphate uridylyltransferase